MSFNTSFHFDSSIQAGITACGYITPTPIQQQAIPAILEGKDLIGLAQTGTGKTAAFALPLLQRLLKGPRKKSRALILAPTRELAQQIHDTICSLGEQTNLRSAVIYGGVSKIPQLRAFTSGTEIIVACPGRLLDLLRAQEINLASIETLILDEADHMFDKGFLPDLRKIIKQLPRNRQSLLFSATMPREIETLIMEVLTDPVHIEINQEKSVPTISHSLLQVSPTTKTSSLLSLLKEEQMQKAIVFTRTKHKAKNLAVVLQKAGFDAISMQGNLSQNKRQQVLEGFRTGQYSIMIATDIAARGIDVEKISHVINYDMPETVEAFTHRTGRTGRAQHTGKAITFITQDDLKMLKAVERQTGISFNYREKGQEQAKITLKRVQGARGNKTAGTASKKAATPPSAQGHKKNKKGRMLSFDFGL